jgi:NAD+ synthetase
MENSTQTLIGDIRHWFFHEKLTHAVVGFSGGIDSAVTAALLDHAGIHVTLVLVSAPNQTRSSNYDPVEFCKRYQNMKARQLKFECPKNIYDMEMSAAFNEAALPIMRNACFYGEVANLRSAGHNAIVVGTANFDEAAYLGFWGKASDAAQDFYPISHLHKSQVYALAKELNVPQEIIDAVPSGDLLWSGDLNDYKMIGATYEQIENVAREAIHVNSRGVLTKLIDAINKVDDPQKFIDNILRNKHKYESPFPGLHVSYRLESFRRYYYPFLRSAAFSAKSS